MNGSQHWLRGSDPGVFGDHQQFAENLTQFNTTSGTFATALSLVTPVVPAGTYRLGVVLQYSGSAGSTIGEYRLLLDGVPVDIETLRVASAGERKTYANIGQGVIGMSGMHTLELQARLSGGAGTFSVDDMKIETWRVA